MKIKTNYFLRNMVDLDITTFAEYLKSSDQNYVILVDDEPIVWAGDNNTPVIYGGEIDVQNELGEIGGLVYDGDEARLQEDYAVLTEFDFLVRFCKDALFEELSKEIKKVGEFDGVCHIFYPTKTEADLALYVGDDDKLSVHIGDGWGNLSDITEKTSPEFWQKFIS